MKTPEQIDREIKSRKPNPAQIASAQEEGLKVCRKLGHLRNKHYNTEQGRVEIRCSRCGRLLGIE